MKTKISITGFIVLLTLLLSACGGSPDKAPAAEPPSDQPKVAQMPTLESAPAEDAEAAPAEAVSDVDPMEVCAANIALPGEPAYPLLYCEDFEVPEGTLMPIGEYSSKELDITNDIYKGLYTLRMDVSRSTDAWVTTSVHDARDFVFQVDGRLASHSGHPYHKWGLMFKKDPDKNLYYYFAIDNNSLYYFMMVRDEKVTNLINGRKSEEINPIDEFNTLTVVTEGDKFSFYINGKFQEDFKDNRIQKGDLGLYFKVSENTILDWEFDNLVVYAD